MGRPEIRALPFRSEAASWLAGIPLALLTANMTGAFFSAPAASVASHLREAVWADVAGGFALTRHPRLRLRTTALTMPPDSRAAIYGMGIGSILPSGTRAAAVDGSPPVRAAAGLELLSRRLRHARRSFPFTLTRQKKQRECLALAVPSPLAATCHCSSRKPP